MATLIGQKAMVRVIAHLPEVHRAVVDEALDRGVKAEAKLTEARGSTIWYKIIGPGHLTYIDVDEGDVDAFFCLVAPNAMAIEFGHQPSGVFGPGGRFGHIKTKAPEGLYILTRSAGII